MERRVWLIQTATVTVQHPKAQRVFNQSKCIVHIIFYDSVIFFVAKKIIAIRPLDGYNAPVRAKRKPVRATLPAASESREDHLERIAELVERKGYARVTDLAE